MNTRDFGMRFFGRMSFGTDERKKVFEKWATMTDEEKLEMMNKRMEAMSSGKHDEFTVAGIDKRCEEWMKKASEEKEAFIKEREEMMEKLHDHFHGHFFGHGRGFGFGGENQREGYIHGMRDKWQGMTDEEKKEFMHKREDMMKSYGSFFDRCFAGEKEPQAEVK